MSPVTEVGCVIHVCVAWDTCNYSRFGEFLYSQNAATVKISSQNNEPKVYLCRSNLQRKNGKEMRITPISFTKYRKALQSLAILAVSMGLLVASRWNRDIVGSIIVGGDTIVKTTGTSSPIGLQGGNEVQQTEERLIHRNDSIQDQIVLKRENYDERESLNGGDLDREENANFSIHEQQALHTATPTGNKNAKVTWLISFPNSGTTYTIHNTEHVSQRSTATNYLTEVHDKGEIMSLSTLDKDNNHGPWQRNMSLPLPRNVLTKTHCAGYSDKATLRNSIITTQKFLQGCSLSMRRSNVSKNSTYQGRLKVVYPHQDLVQGVIHLIRDPFDNIISRMHHGIRVRQKRHGLTNEQILKILDSPETFVAWCQGSDRAFWMGSHVMDNLGIPFNETTLSNVPCHSDFFRYIEWHNAALEMIEREQLPSLVVYYEDYETNYNQTLDSILDFLELSREAETLPFTTGKTYKDEFFSPDIQAATIAFLESIASKKLWHLLQRYVSSTSGRKPFASRT